MNAVQIENHNKAVGVKDTVIIVGDFAWKRHMHFIHALNGKKLLVIGNHDRMPAIALQQFTEVIGTPRKPGIYQKHVDSKYCIFSHFPMWSWDAAFHGSWHFYGHCHGRKREFAHKDPDSLTENEGVLPPPRLAEFANGLSCAVDVDVWDYTPVPWEVLRAKMEGRTSAWRERRECWRKDDSTPKTDSRDTDYYMTLAAENRTWRGHKENYSDSPVF